MLYKYRKYTISLFLLILSVSQYCLGGPPFLTDDPVPVPFRHWEYYISSINTFQHDVWSGTSPHFEANYGLFRNMQVHLLLPVNYLHFRHQTTKFGYADTEFGIKYCFLQETDNHPQIGTFPIIEIPTVRNDEFSNGRVKIFIPVWIQKTWNRFTTYGGAGYSINPGPESKNAIFTGWEAQYDFSKVVSLGGEIYFQSADEAGSKSVTAFNIGGYINLSEEMHIIFSAGHSLVNENFTSAYLGLLWTI